MFGLAHTGHLIKHSAGKPPNAQPRVGHVLRHLPTTTRVLASSTLLSLKLENKPSAKIFYKRWRKCRKYDKRADCGRWSRSAVSIIYLDVIHLWLASTKGKDEMEVWIIDTVFALFILYTRPVYDVYNYYKNPTSFACPENNSASLVFK